MFFFFIAEFKRATEIRKIDVYSFLMFSSFRVLTVLRQIVSGQKVVKNCGNQSKSTQFVTSCAGHVDWMKK